MSLLKRTLKITSQILLVLVVLFFTTIVYLRLTVEPLPQHGYFQEGEFLVLAHRGGRGLWPENTLYAFEHAVDLGVDVLDFDVHGLADGSLVLLHDSALDRTTNGTGEVTGYTLGELQQLDAGYRWTDDDGKSFPFRGRGIRIPELSEVFAAFPDTRMNIEIKQGPDNVTRIFCDKVREYGMQDKVVVASFSAEMMQEFRTDCPDIATAAGVGEAAPFFILNLVYLAGIWHPPAETLQMPGFRNGRPMINKRFINAAHQHNLFVYVWTVNDQSELQAMVEMGVDGIITDYPDRLLAIMANSRIPAQEIHE